LNKDNSTLGLCIAYGAFNIHLGVSKEAFDALAMVIQPRRTISAVNTDATLSPSAALNPLRPVPKGTET
jgi:hypothetical protein